MDGRADGQAYRIGLDVATDRVSAVESRVPPEAGNRDQRKAVVTANRANVGGHIMRVRCRLMAMSGRYRRAAIPSDLSTKCCG